MHVQSSSEAAPHRPPEQEEHWRQRLADLADRFAVPGAVLGVWSPRENWTVAHGVTNVATGVPATPDTLFQIGSITKVWTATVALRLVDEGRLDLDAPIRSYLPDLALATEELTSGLTLRHLLTHTSGIDGDVFEDFGRGDDCLARYVAALAAVPQNFPLGATWSYCNAGFVIVGRVIEQVTGLVWDDAMRDLLYRPLGLARSVTLPEEALLHRAAAGHTHQGQEAPARAGAWMLPRSMGPAGLVASTAQDVLAFARMHLRDGLADDGTRVVSQRAVRGMRAQQAALPDPHGIAHSWGLGWFRASWGGTEVLGHDGSTVGQAAFLRVLPEHNLAVTLLTNGGQARDLYETLVRAVIRDRSGVEMARPLEPPDTAPDLDHRAHAGTYERTGVRIEVSPADRGLRLRILSTQDVAGLRQEPMELDARGVREGLYAMRMPGASTWTPVVFRPLPDGTPCLHGGSRANPRVA